MALSKSYLPLLHDEGCLLYYLRWATSLRFSKRASKLTFELTTFMLMLNHHRGKCIAQSKSRVFEYGYESYSNKVMEKSLKGTWQASANANDKSTMNFIFINILMHWSAAANSSLLFDISKTHQSYFQTFSSVKMMHTESVR